MARLRVEAVAAELRASFGNQSAVARKFGVSRQAVAKFIETRPALQVVLDEAQQSILDNAESALYRAILQGEPWAVKWLLATKGKSRGYVERQEVTGQGGEPLTITIRRVNSAGTDV